MKTRIGFMIAGMLLVATFSYSQEEIDVQRAYEKACAENTTRAYDKFLKKYPESSWTDDVLARRYVTDQVAARLTNDLEEVRLFLAAYEHAARQPFAKELAAWKGEDFLAASRREVVEHFLQLRYDLAVRNRSIAGLEEFLADCHTYHFENAPNHDSAVRKLYDLRSTEAEEKNTIDGYLDFLDNFPASPKTPAYLEKLNLLSQAFHRYASEQKYIVLSVDNYALIVQKISDNPEAQLRFIHLDRLRERMLERDEQERALQRPDILRISLLNTDIIGLDNYGNSREINPYNLRVGHIVVLGSPNGTDEQLINPAELMVLSYEADRLLAIRVTDSGVETQRTLARMRPDYLFLEIGKKLPRSIQLIPEEQAATDSLSYIGLVKVSFSERELKEWHEVSYLPEGNRVVNPEENVCQCRFSLRLELFAPRLSSNWENLTLKWKATDRLVQGDHLSDIPFLSIRVVN